ncbi:hypothetical protein SDC9_203793 [bioreactor metagenome]|uniref:Uncharacterized protein n=1 Tax=bioreactor metagenome TaxID=1076179 RepID=A0A645IY82_9ZZZZ
MNHELYFRFLGRNLQRGHFGDRGFPFFRNFRISFVPFFLGEERLIDHKRFTDDSINPCDVFFVNAVTLELPDRFKAKLLVFDEHEDPARLTVEPVEQLAPFELPLDLVGVHERRFVDDDQILVFENRPDFFNFLDDENRFGADLAAGDHHFRIADVNQSPVDERFGFGVRDPLLLG